LQFNTICLKPTRKPIYINLENEPLRSNSSPTHIACAMSAFHP
jgi:hypothetical protein